MILNKVNNFLTFLIIFCFNIFPFIVEKTHAKQDCLSEFTNGLNILILGDSIFNTQDLENHCENLTSILAKKYNTSNIFNQAIDGGQFIIKNHDFSNLDILDQYFKYNWDVIIIGGGGNDLMNCDFQTNCFKETTTLISQTLKKFLTSNKLQSTKIYFIYITQVSDFAPPEWQKIVNLGAGEEIKEMYQDISKENSNYEFIDLYLAMPNDKDFWLSDGYHPSLKTYKLIPDLLN